MINSIENFELHELTNPKFIVPKLAKYRQNGIDKSWELIKSHDSVAILIYHKENNSFIFVKQFRPPIYYSNGERNGVTLELCAGLVDKDKSLQEIAQEEIEEECGYKVSSDSIEKITAFHTAVGHSGGCQTLFYCEVDESMHISSGGGIDSELIEVIEMTPQAVQEILFDESIIKTSGLIFSIYWWHNTKRAQII